MKIKRKGYRTKSIYEIKSFLLLEMGVTSLFQRVIFHNDSYKRESHYDILAESMSQIINSQKWHFAKIYHFKVIQYLIKPIKLVMVIYYILLINYIFCKLLFCKEKLVHPNVFKNKKLCVR